MRETADTVFIGGHALLPGAAGRPAAGVAVRAGRIVAVAPDDELRRPDRARHRGRRPGRRAPAARLPGRPRPPGHGRHGDAAVRPARHARRPQECLDIVAAYARGQPRPRVDRRRRLVDGVLRRRHADPRGARRRRPRPPGLPHQPRRPRPLGQLTRPRARRHRRGHPRPRRRHGSSATPTATPPAPCTRARATWSAGCFRRPADGRPPRRAADRPGAAVLARHHRLAGRRGRRSMFGDSDILPTYVDRGRARVRSRPGSSAPCGGTATAASEQIAELVAAPRRRPGRAGSRPRA